MNEAPILEISGLHISFKTDEGYLPAIKGVDLTIHPGETVALVGESGCGKSVTSLSVMRLLPKYTKVSGSIRFKGQELLDRSETAMRKIRGREISMIFQEPMTALNPVMRVVDQICEPLRLHESLTNRQMRARALELLSLVGIPRPEQIADEYPHQLSGGMRQRVMIAMAMACQPKLLIADEPTTALDVTVQAQILDLLRRLQQETKMALLLITHDLGVVAEVCSRAAVMYAGRIIEEAEIHTLFDDPRHPYTNGLLSSIPRIKGARERLQPIPGNVPSLANMPNGCHFAPRCQHAMEQCHHQEPELVAVADDHRVSCWLEQGGDVR